MGELNTVPGFSCVEPSGAFYAFPNILETGYSAHELQDWLLNEAGVATISGTSFFTFSCFGLTIYNLQCTIYRLQFTIYSLLQMIVL